jgi:[protein-PII] uridylyltransferase
MLATENIKAEFLIRKEKLFAEHADQSNSLKFGMLYSILIEEFIFALAGNNKYEFALASAGSFSRRELSPFSDIDLMFIANSVEASQKDIVAVVTLLWDNGIEVSHTVRDFSDIKKYLGNDLHTFTQFYETRMILGNETVYNKWNKEIIDCLTPKTQKKMLSDFFGDIQARYEKYGDSPKVLEPNVKYSAGGLRDFQAIEWMYFIKNKTLLNKQNETSQAEAFIELLEEINYTTPNECNRLLHSYKMVLAVRNLLHMISNQKTDRFEFNMQQKIAPMFYPGKDALQAFMQEYFKATNVIHRFSKSMLKKFQEDITNPLPDSLAIDLDDDFVLKGKTIYFIGKNKLTLSDVLRGFYYRGLHTSHFDEEFRSRIVEIAEQYNETTPAEAESSVFFREILRLQKNVGATLLVMNELGVLRAYLPEFKDLIGFLQHGVYHCYTADEHTLITIQNIEKLEKDTSPLGKIYNSLKDREFLYLGLLFHDIAKPIDISGHEIIGSEMASSIMNRLGYSEDEIELVTFLVRNHLMMEQIAFRRNLNDPETLNNFTAHFPSLMHLDLLYLVTYADLSAVNPAVWTSWKAELLSELYLKAKSMLAEQMTGEELLMSSTYIIPKEISKHSKAIC